MSDEEKTQRDDGAVADGAATGTQLLAALETIATAIRTGTSVLTNDRSTPTAPQARSTLDYLVIRQMLGRGDGTDRTVAAFRNCTGDGRTVSFPNAPAEAVTAAIHTDDGRPPEVLALEDDSGTTGRTAQKGQQRTQARKVTLGQITKEQPLTRIELRNADGLPIRLGPRLSCA
jgi:hypothetical protein